MTNNEGDTVEYNLVMVKRAVPDEHGNRHMAFATNIPIRSARALVDTILELYHKGWKPRPDSA